MNSQPFQINVPQTVLDDLQERLARTRWPDEVEGAAWDYGTNLEYMKELAHYWQHDYDWRKQEAALNKFPHFKADIDGMNIHIIHERGKGAKPIPLILTHGWPGSFYEFVKLIPLLTDPASYGGDPNLSFDVVVPSIPGFGFSDRPRQRGWTLEKTTDVWLKLMTEILGYQTFAASGTDWGSGITRLLACKYPEKLTAIYLSYVSYPDFTPPNPEHLSEAEQAHLKRLQGFMWTEGAYAMIQSTKPQTLAYGLSDSPVGLAGWLVEKFRSLSDSNGDIEMRFTKDELITMIMIYWITETANSAARTYFENKYFTTPLKVGEHIEVPAGVGNFIRHSHTPREYVERSLRVRHWAEIPKGGHFAAFEEPELLARDMQEFFSQV